MGPCSRLQQCRTLLWAQSCSHAGTSQKKRLTLLGLPQGSGCPKKKG